MNPTPVPLADVDLADLGVFERNEAWGMFDTLRREAPVHWNQEHDGGSGFWSITRYDDIERIDKDPETFTSTKFTNLEEPPEEFQERRRSLLETDGPRHLVMRKLLMRDFTSLVSYWAMICFGNSRCSTGSVYICTACSVTILLA